MIKVKKFEHFYPFDSDLYFIYDDVNTDDSYDYLATNEPVYLIYFTGYTVEDIKRVNLKPCGTTSEYGNANIFVYDLNYYFNLLIKAKKLSFGSIAYINTIGHVTNAFTGLEVILPKENHVKAKLDFIDDTIWRLQRVKNLRIANQQINQLYYLGHRVYENLWKSTNLVQPGYEEDNSESVASYYGNDLISIEVTPTTLLADEYSTNLSIVAIVNNFKGSGSSIASISYTIDNNDYTTKITSFDKNYLDNDTVEYTFKVKDPELKDKIINAEDGKFTLNVEYWINDEHTLSHTITYTCYFGNDILDNPFHWYISKRQNYSPAYPGGPYTYYDEIFCFPIPESFKPITVGEQWYNPSTRRLEKRDILITYDYLYDDGYDFQQNITDVIYNNNGTYETIFDNFTYSYDVFDIQFVKVEYLTKYKDSNRQHYPNGVQTYYAKYEEKYDDKPVISNLYADGYEYAVNTPYNLSLLYWREESDLGYRTWTADLRIVKRKLCLCFYPMHSLVKLRDENSFDTISGPTSGGIGLQLYNNLNDNGQEITIYDGGSFSNVHTLTNESIYTSQKENRSRYTYKYRYGDEYKYVQFYVPFVYYYDKDGNPIDNRIEEDWSDIPNDINI